MALGFSVSSLGFIARFIIAFIIIAYLYSKDHNDPAVKKGFVVLVSLGAAVIVLGFIVFTVVLATGGAAFLGNALANFRYMF
ncbi:MAG: hypothetical protein E7484_05200 [Ruminococcaceae bacterium]|nr:hypothetical protein [Oscillospiraceae bacterium]